MPRHMLSVGLPIEIGHQLTAFARANDMTMGEAVAALMRCGAKNGLGNSLALPGIKIEGLPDRVQIDIYGFPLAQLMFDEARSFAAELAKVATTPGATILDLDLPDTVQIARRGNGVVLSITRKNASHKKGEADFRRVFSCVVAKAIADRIEDEVKTAIDVERLVGDLDLSETAAG